MENYSLWLWKEHGKLGEFFLLLHAVVVYHSCNSAVVFVFVYFIIIYL